MALTEKYAAQIEKTFTKYPDKRSAVMPMLHLAQEELAQLLGASRQRVNQELKAMEREEAIRIEPGGLVVLDRAALMRISEADDQ